MRQLLIVLFIILGILPGVAEVKWHSVKTDYYLQCAQNSKLPVNKRLAFYDSIIDKSGSDVPVSIYNEQAALYEKEGLYKKALDVYHKVQTIISPDDVREYASLLLNSAIAAYHSNRMREAIGKVYELENLGIPDSLRYNTMDGYRLLGFIMSSSDNDSLAAHYLSLAWKEYAKSAGYMSQKEKDRMTCRLHFAQSEMYLSFGKTDLALDHLREARALCRDSLLMADICGSLGRICEMNKDYSAAEEFYKEAISWTDMHPNRVVNIGNYVYLLLAQNRLAEAREMMNKNEALFQIFRGANAESYIERLKYRVAKASGDTRGALKSMERLFALDDSVKASQSSVYIKDIVAEYEDVSRKDYEKHFMAVSRNKTIAIWCLIGMVLICGGAVWSWNRKYKKEKECRMEQESRLDQIEEDNMEKSRKLEEDVESGNKEMLSMSMRVRKMNEWFDNLSSIAKNPSIPAKEKVEKMTVLLDKMGSQNNVQKMFGVYFSRVNNVFFNRLFRLHPDLSTGEIRLCGYIQMGLTSKEIANLTNRSVRTVDNIKYSIRKKMGISEPTESYIRSIATATDKEFKERYGRL